MRNHPSTGAALASNSDGNSAVKVESGVRLVITELWSRRPVGFVQPSGLCLTGLVEP